MSLLKKTKSIVKSSPASGKDWSGWSNDDKNSFVLLISTNKEFRQSVYEKIKTDQYFKAGLAKEIISDQQFRTAVVMGLGSDSVLRAEIVQAVKTDTAFLEKIKGATGPQGLQGPPGPTGVGGPQGPAGDVSKQFLKESTLWCADGGLCTLPKGKNGIDWGYGGSKIYDEGQLIIESDDNIYFKTWNKDTLLLNKEGAMISNPDQKSYTTLGIGGGYIFRNGVDRAEDGGGGTMTVRNDKGNLRLMATGGTVFAQDRNILAELDQLKAKTVNIAYTQRPFVQYSANGTDLANQPIRQTVVGCQDACNANPACIGFSRGKGVADTVVDNCWLKQAYPNPVFNDNSYQTFVKPGAIYPQS